MSFRGRDGPVPNPFGEEKSFPIALKSCVQGERPALVINVQ